MVRARFSKHVGVLHDVRRRDQELWVHHLWPPARPAGDHALKDSDEEGSTGRYGLTISHNSIVMYIISNKLSISFLTNV